jgi:hypothetical protein
MKIYIQLLGREPQELGLSVDRLLYGEPNKDEWKSAVLYLSGSFKKHQGFLDMVSSFELSFVSGGQEIGKMIHAAVLESTIVDSLETICLQISGKMKLVNLLDLETPK